MRQLNEMDMCTFTPLNNMRVETLNIEGIQDISGSGHSRGIFLQRTNSLSKHLHDIPQQLVIFIKIKSN